MQKLQWFLLKNVYWLMKKMFSALNEFTVRVWLLCSLNKSLVPFACRIRLQDGIVLWTRKKPKRPIGHIDHLRNGSLEHSYHFTIPMCLTISLISPLKNMKLRLNKCESLLTKDAFCQVACGFSGLPRKTVLVPTFMRVWGLRLEKPALAG